RRRRAGLHRRACVVSGLRRLAGDVGGWPRRSARRGRARHLACIDDGAARVEQVMPSRLPPPQRALLTATNGDPFAVLGPHVERGDRGPRLVIRACLPRAASVTVVPLTADLRPQAMRAVHPDGLFEAAFDGVTTVRPYKLRVRRRDTGDEVEQFDPYSFGLLLGDLDLHLLGEGRHMRLHHCLGAHPMAIDGVQGTRFAVWAPNALRVSVVGDFNDWDGRVHPMRQRHHQGVWEIFLPGVGPGDRYKYEIRSRVSPVPFLKADPCGAAYEHPPATASIVMAPSAHVWQDADWIDARRAAREGFDRPMAIYEVHLGSWARTPDNRFLTY